MSGSGAVSQFMSGVTKRNPGELEFHQAVGEVAADLIPFIEANPVTKKIEFSRG